VCSGETRIRGELPISVRELAKGEPLQPQPVS
jgi:hypothetical protein